MPLPGPRFAWQTTPRWQDCPAGSRSWGGPYASADRLLPNEQWAAHDSVRCLPCLCLPNTLDHPILGGGGFLGASLILRPEPPQGTFQVGEAGCFPSWHHPAFGRLLRGRLGLNSDPHYHIPCIPDAVHEEQDDSERQYVKGSIVP